MKIKLKKINGKNSGKEISIPDTIFSIKPNDHAIYLDIKNHRANQRQGTSKVKERGEIVGSTKKIKKQKGTGTARAGSIKSPLFKGGGQIFGPKPRDYSTKLPKKIRSLGLKHALSSKVKNDELIILDEAKLSSPKTRDFLSKVKKLKIENALFIDSDDFDKNFELAIKNVKGLELINIKGINVYDILRKEKLVLTKSSIDMLNERLQWVKKIILIF